MARELTDRSLASESTPGDKCAPRGVPYAHTFSDEELA